MAERRAIVTGAGQRLGRAMALHLGAQGYDVAVHYAGSATAAEEVADVIRAQGQRAVALQADLLHEEATQSLIARAAEALGGPLCLLINNASIFEPDTIASASRESWDRHMGSNLRAPFVLTQCFAEQAPPPILTARNEPEAQALIVNMIDQRVRKPTPDFMTYTLAKMGLWALTQTSAQALAPKVRVNAIGPGPTLQGARQSAEDFAAQRASTILQRGAEPSDIMAAPAVTGQLLCVDGGQHLGWQTPDVMGVE
jgi:NAD(P)-dependent dehydrogenase (short-subunit alcohol dehydrogenase family)